LPNVGKSTLFNALTRAGAAQAANYPFCTIEPNVGEVAVPEPRLHTLAEIAKSKEIIPARMNFVDIAGLVRGASKGEGLGNQFLANIRECEAIAHVLRCFHDDNVTHVEGQIDPIADLETVETELMLADLESLERRSASLEKKAKSGEKEAALTLDLVVRTRALLEAGRPARTLKRPTEQESAFEQLQLLTSLPMLYVCNVDETHAANGNAHSARVAERAKAEGAAAVVICAQMEAELAAFDEREQQEFLAAAGLAEPGLARLIHAGYDLLGLQTYFTAGPKEARAWTIHKGWTAPKAAGVIHSDFEQGFIRAETIAYDDYVRYGGEIGARDAGRMRLEGRDYVVQEGDVMHFRFNA